MEKTLKQIYGDKITIKNHSNALEIEYGTANKSGNPDIAVYLNYHQSIAVIWNVKHRRNCNGSLYLTLNIKWNEIKLSDAGLQYEYKSFKLSDKLQNKKEQYEKVLIVSYETLQKIKHDLYDYLKFDSADEISDEIIKKKDDSLYEWHDEKARERKSTSTWERNYRFRKAVLENYNYSCAVCGCDVEKILEAAHIKAVFEGGSDDVENGICLCRNHHKMFDEELYKINFEEHSIYDVDDTVKKYMEDYREITLSNREKNKM